METQFKDEWHNEIMMAMVEEVGLGFCSCAEEEEHNCGISSASIALIIIW